MSYFRSVFRVMRELNPEQWASHGFNVEEVAQSTALDCFRIADVNCDGCISFEEFKHWYLDDATPTAAHFHSAAAPSAPAAAVPPPPPQQQHPSWQAYANASAPPLSPATPAADGKSSLRLLLLL